MDTLQELRDAHFQRQERKAFMIKIAKQLEDINRLKQEKELLQYKRQALMDGCPVTDLYPSVAVQDEEFLALHNTFTSLKQKLSMCRLLGPCGLTVLDVQSKSLAVSFTSVWKDLTQSFVLHITDNKNKVTVAGTTIPYFIDVDSMISGQENVDWSKVIDDLGYLLNAYTQRRREVERVQVEHESVLKKISHNDPVTVVEIELAFPAKSHQDSNPNNTSNPDTLHVKICLVSDDIHKVYPNKISFASSHFISKEERTEIRNLLKSKPLSQAFLVLLERLAKIPIDGDEEEDIS